MMLKKIFGLIVVAVFTVSLVACGGDPVIIDIEDLNVDMIEGGTYQIDFDTNDSKGLNFESGNQAVITVSSSGLVTAVAEGETTVIITSKDDPTVKVTVTVNVSKNYTLTAPSTSVTLRVGETKDVVYTSNDDVTFTSANTNIFTVDSTGLITAVAEGIANLTIQSVGNSSLSVTISIAVRKIVTLDTDSSEETIWIGGTTQLTYESNDEVIYETEDETIALVSATGLVTGVGVGDVKVIIRSSYDHDVFEEVIIHVYNTTQTIMITGDTKVNVGSEKSLLIEVAPDVAYAFVSWESSDESIATIDGNGLINAIQPGNVVITATSLYDNSIEDSFNLEIVNYILVDESKVASDTVVYSGLTFEYGAHLFQSIGDAMEAATEHATIFVFTGTYTGNLTFDTNHVTLKAVTTANINGIIEIQSDGITIDGFSFMSNSKVFSNVEIENFTFVNNQAIDLTLADDAFLSIKKVTTTTIRNNTIMNLNQDAIIVEDYRGGTILVEKNLITNVQQAITVSAVSEYDENTKLLVSRNDISNASIGIEMNKKYAGTEKDILAYARFNSVINSTQAAAKSELNSTVDFTLNFWGGDETNPLLFPNIDDYYLRGAYQAKADIITEAKFRADLPVTFVITNPISDITLGDMYTLQYDVLPMELVTDRVRWITGNPAIMTINTVSGSLSPLKSGMVTLTLRSSVDISINITITITVTTTPGIELTPTHQTNDLIVGDSFTLDAAPYPFDIADADVSYESSNPLIATINEFGLVTTLAAGDVTFTATLVDDPTVQTSYTISVYTALDQNNLARFTYNLSSYLFK
jgi:N-acetylmuramoyl-L-alanine amidase